jgi:glycosyltransferase involved in cell wall biosynthesis
MREHVNAAATRDGTIHLAGRLQADDVWRAYAAADMLAGPSHSEGWGLVVNEAMAADLPVVVTEAYGCAIDLVRDGETGLVVPPGYAHALAGALRTLIEAPVLRRRMAVNAHALISDWTIERQAQRISEIWSRVLNKDAKGRAMS